jgi:uncharacterized membrane protein YkoI
MQRSNRALTWIATAAAAVGISVGVAGLAGAATGGSSSGSGTTTTTPAAAQAPANAPDPATVDHGPGETLLTGDTAAKVTAAAKAAVPGATVLRVETDSDGAAYEAHLQKSDGSYVTVELDASFKVTATEDGFGGGGPGGHHGDHADETPLTGDTAAKVTAAAKAAVPGATVLRVETDSDGATYEAHLQKSDGSMVTVKLDKSFKVTSTEAGPDGHGPGAPPSSGSGSSGTSSSGTTGA